ncbi:hypothetical protein D1AOALGA4SA_1537 [Olavius algarvensis Delta 1 endosymbiont]|nr:hypothetical protein D1AOALGA4SA_1537 [Olavius algarvensis Delta 1 endosymbiont]
MNFNRLPPFVGFIFQTVIDNPSLLSGTKCLQIFYCYLVD